MAGYLLTFGAISFLGTLLGHASNEARLESARLLFALFLAIFVVRMFAGQDQIN